MTNRALLLVAAVAAALIDVSAAAAQSSRAAQGEIGVAYSFMRLEGVSASTGIGVDASRVLGRSANNVDILLVGDVSINHFGATTELEATTQSQVMAGVRFAGRMSGGASPFAQLLGGAVACCGGTSPAVMVGVGVSAPLGKQRTRLRLQADFPTVFNKAGISDGVAYEAYRSTGVRVNAGVAIPFGR